MRSSIIISQMFFLLLDGLCEGEAQYFAIGIILCCIYHAITETKESNNEQEVSDTQFTDE